MPGHHTVSPVQRITGILLLLAAGGLTVFFATTYTGPYRWLAEWQLKWAGSYEAQITFIVTLLLVAAPVLLLAWIIRKASGPAADGSALPMPVSDLEFKRFMGRYGFALMLGIVGAVFLVMAAHELWRASGADHVADVPATALEQGGSVNGTWVALQGKALLDRAEGVEESNSAEVTLYVPVVSDTWKPGNPIAAFIEVANRDMDDDLKDRRSTRHAGMVTLTGLPGMVRAAFERDGMPPAKNYTLVEYGRTPADARKGGMSLLTIAGVAIAAAGGLVAFDRYKRRYLIPNHPAAATNTPPKTYAIKAVVPLADRSEATAPPNPPTQGNGT